MVCQTNLHHPLVGGKLAQHVCKANGHFAIVLHPIQHLCVTGDKERQGIVGRCRRNTLVLGGLGLALSSGMAVAAFLIGTVRCNYVDG